ncbi:hypothetical protein TPHA_0J00830 [Tetrapisispora phaffii CBS 4417]|uniref:BHLH domain-containing protein n=1 Tax=Tetrapisispora phaffii (strain ATCC 24235 / CBS 4417 / NBRC 1672 / NRRL Y-8282 / UCD 70-5) TaxID=1071381 RepID=G8BYG4_TETPH|nr:hypothetical protein TPHA_0J00830 [Tetrapisispora phaffii CBS 4417]CCE64906.1 hypothetical protein TPHA_0J00830 [Tetrapisispora phaffii CBS 4417]
MHTANNFFELINGSTNKDDDFDLGIDFDTAYNIFKEEFSLDAENANNNLFNNIASPVRNEVPPLEETLVEPPSNSKLPETPIANEETLDLHIKEILNHGNTNIQTPALLTTIESSAIENFLESVMTSNPSPPSFNHHVVREPHVSPALTTLSHIHTPSLPHDDYRNVGLELSPIITRPNEIPFIVPPNTFVATNSKIHNIYAKYSSFETSQEVPVENLQTSTDFEEILTRNKLDFKESDVLQPFYAPGNLYLPELRISDSEVPLHIKEDTETVKKWKHVEAEKKRRNLIKRAFDNLISIMNVSKNDDNNTLDSDANIYLTTSGKVSKRVPKHIQLRRIVHDIKLITKANEKLEHMLKNDIIEIITYNIN